MNPSGQGELPAGVAAAEENMEEKQRSELGITTKQEKNTELPAISEKQPATPVPDTPTSPTAISPSSQSGDSDIGAGLNKYDSKIVQVREVPDGDAALAHLPENERAVLKRQLFTPDVNVTYTALYRYATAWDLVFIVIAAISAIGAGVVQPLMTVVFGNLSGTFQGLILGTLSGSFNSTLDRYVLYFIYLAIGEFCLVYISTVLFIYTGEHITAKVREQYLRAILRQNIGYFDKLGAGEVTTRITSDTNLIQEGISEKVGLTLTGVAAFFSAFVIGFVKFWKLTLICMSTVVAIVLIMGLGGRKMAAWNKKSLASYAVGGSVAEEVLASIRNAVAFGTQDKLAKQYNVHLLEARRWGIRSKSTLGCMIGALLCIIFLNYGLAFWMGSRFLVGGETNLSHILTIILAVMIGAFSFGNVGPNIQHFAAGVAAAAKIYATIDRDSPLDPLSEEGERLDHVEGTVELRHIKHIYPSRPEVVVMEDVSLLIPAGKTTALVGASGSGKSTIVGLVERFYDPVGGTVLLDGHEINTLNLHWLRQQISLVQQEPILFSQTIKENIRNGLIGSKYEAESEEQQTQRIVEAAKKANAHDFIMSLTDGYETHVGERGFLLSGGQKQRVAIARAIVSDPKILLLDEATSALDTKSEGVVQHALDEAAKGRTTIVIAHRLSTIKTADNIVVMQNGRIIEQGTHDELLALGKAYYSLVSAQRITSEHDDEAAKETDTSEEGLTKIQSSRSGSAAMAAPEDVKLALGRTKSQKSVSSKVLADKKSETENKYSLLTLVKFMLSFNRTEWHIMCVALVFSCIAGAAQPVQGIFFAKSIVSLSRPLSERHQIRHDVDFWALMYLMLAFVTLLAMVTQGTLFAYCSESLIQRARDGAFRRFLRQDISFFDEDQNSTGALTSFLSTEATHLASISGATLGTLLNCTTTLVVAVVIALAIGWKLALVCMCALPVILGTGFIRFWILAKFSAIAQKSYEKSAGYACEHTNAIRTVASLTTERQIYAEYQNQLNTQLRASLRSNLRNSSLYAASQSAMFLAFALGFWYGGTLMARGEYTMFQFFIVFSEIIFGAQSAGTVFSFAGDMSHAKNAAAALKTLYDRQPTIDPWSEDGEHIQQIHGNIEFKDVHFRYPTRPEVPVLRGLNLTVRPGQYVALVGASGCGKSTTIALLERFYDPLAGGVYIDGKAISSLNLNDYRSHLALVSQEPTLYQGTIKDNVLLGADRGAVSDERVIQACKDANIYDFIMSLPDGFATDVGSKAALLSGGQKQRIAIARALLRNPKVLLLDEATSALDSESEKVVQAALDDAAKGRTTIAVAHRLSTIQKADMIYVFDKGVIAEYGTHNELMAIHGRYRELVSLQNLEKRQ
ncbi:ATP-binding cassette, subfamily B (MDR/TAP), member 1 [Capronia coronata CBS 617.96]|uniref:ATP-binding cassette, subfamily B (MDR/TAP), member 1 n=1 Tax=Capronia coronata CBS 617.96 TaxID=1182541 RepID=W9YMX3_9EURO|nr:ATP-binding cassette, subfamily B (MDR/TAP), member 1 [Capronia coronata CBS 617.96]EXJ91025.1 ATP-binding cassette, subfamily B (MDR/TAP), member 1 [Capronia coronata CBS 617.96]